MALQAVRIAVIRTKGMRNYELRFGGMHVDHVPTILKPAFYSRTYADPIDLGWVDWVQVAETVHNAVKLQIQNVHLPF